LTTNDLSLLSLNLNVVAFSLTKLQIGSRCGLAFRAHLAKKAIILGLNACYLRLHLHNLVINFKISHLPDDGAASQLVSGLDSQRDKRRAFRRANHRLVVWHRDQLAVVAD
jgi:hypothetical protein